MNIEEMDREFKWLEEIIQTYTKQVKKQIQNENIQLTPSHAFELG